MLIERILFFKIYYVQLNFLSSGDSFDSATQQKYKLIRL